MRIFRHYVPVFQNWSDGEDVTSDDYEWWWDGLSISSSSSPPPAEDDPNDPLYVPTSSSQSAADSDGTKEETCSSGDDEVGQLINQKPKKIGNIRVGGFRGGTGPPSRTVSRGGTGLVPVRRISKEKTCTRIFDVSGWEETIFHLPVRQSLDGLIRSFFGHY